ncbi:MAG TPA: hypothetical protein VEZ14_05185 [Dehalococcoidia bacterium]|nr:hypothetical protein [Dehalococcoidia bacterium]
MTRTKKVWIAAAAGFVLVLAGAGAVLAQTPGTPGTGTTFLDRVAQKLGISTPKLQDAIKGASSDQLKSQVANGDLTQQPADRIQQGLNNRVDNGTFGFGPGSGMHAKGFPRFGFALGQESQKLADFLGIPLAQLKTELSANGATLATVAQGHGKTRDQLKTFITGEAKAKLDQAVKNQDITQKQEDSALSMLSGHIDQLIDSHFLGRHGFRGMTPNGPIVPMTPGTTPHPQGAGPLGAFDRG